MQLSELFDIRNGIVRSGLVVSDCPFENSVPFLRPASTQQRTIAGWVSRNDVGKKNIYPAYSLFVSTNGEGSHSYSYVSSFEFSCNSDVSVLIPKRTMSINEKVFFSRCITMNRYKFSYGRKPKGYRLKGISLPESIPEWTSEYIYDNVFSGLDSIFLDEQYTENNKEIKRNYLVPLIDVFDVRYGHSLELNKLKVLSRDKGGIPFVSRTMKNNGIAAYVEPIDGVVPADAGEITCALSGNVLASFLQDSPFYTAYHVACLNPKVSMNTESKLFYCTCLFMNRNRYSYGRQANRTIKDILIPAPNAIPDWINGSLRQVISNLRNS